MNGAASSKEASPLVKEIIKNVIQTLMSRGGDEDLRVEASRYAKQVDEMDEMNRRMLTELVRLSGRLDQVEKTLVDLREPLDFLADELDILGMAVQTWIDKGGRSLDQLAAIYAGLRAEMEEVQEEEEDRPRRGM